MLLIEFDTHDLYREVAYAYYCYSSMGRLQDESYLDRCFEGFKDFCAQYNVQLVDVKNDCTQARNEKERLCLPYKFAGLITCIESEKQIHQVKEALAEGKNVIALFPSSTIHGSYPFLLIDKEGEAKALHNMFLVANKDIDEGHLNKIGWEEIDTGTNGRLFISTDIYLSDAKFLNGWGWPIELSEDYKQNVTNLIREFSTFKQSVISISSQPYLTTWPCHEPINFMIDITNHGPELRNVEIAMDLLNAFEPVGSLERYIHRLKTQATTRFALPLIPQYDGRFKNILTLNITSDRVKSPPQSFFTISNIEITPASGTQLYHQLKQDDLGLTNLLTMFDKIQGFSEVKKLPPLMRVDPSNCLNQMRIIGEKLSFSVLSQKFKAPYVGSFNSAIEALRKHNLVSLRSIGYLHTVRQIGNLGSHPYPEPLSETDVRIVSYALASIAEEIVIKNLI
ncbi:hypothetical protein ccbrp13_20960 [Ktedonobacteria bacterium brp13]|nr:hypothetical protein ccbrp13_20960 [Ktedonobacteria bacterium brp13]